MATTVRQVKRLGKRSASSSKLVPAPCWNSIPQFAEVDGNGDKFNTVGSYKLTPPPYRMPPQPLYSEPANIPGSTTPSIQQIHTHSNKFPIEREVILSNYDKNSKIPILNEYHRKHKSSSVAPDAPNVHIAWTEDRPRTYCEIRCSANPNVSDNVNMEYHRTYKAQPLSLLDSTNGTEPSPIINQDDSNGFVSGYQKSSGRSHSTPETDVISKPFPSRTYHTIKDMISSRFSKSKTDQIPETGLNNSESNDAIAKPDNNLSPHSQLVQRGVYLGSAQQCNRNTTQTPSMTTYGNGSDGIDIAKRNQEIREQIIGQYRERAVDVGQTAGVSQQAAGVKLPTDVAAVNSCKNRSLESVSTKQTLLDSETPNRFRDQTDARNVGCNLKSEHIQSGNVARNVKRFQNGSNGNSSIRLNEICEPSSSALPPVYVRKPISGHGQGMYEQQVERNVQNENYGTQTASTSRDIFKRDGMNYEPQHSISNPKSDERFLEQRNISNQLLNDTKYNSVNAIEHYGISRARSNDHLLESTCNKSPYARKDLPLKQKSKSFENLGNNNENEANKIEVKSNGPLSGMNSDYEKHRCGGQSDSGRGSTVYSSGKLKRTTDTSPDSSEPHRITTNKDNQWADIVENELKHILEPKSNASIANSTLSDSSASPPLPPVSPEVSSDEITPSYKRKGLYNSKMEMPYRTAPSSTHNRGLWSRANAKEKVHQRLSVSMKRSENANKLPSTVASSSVDLDSMLDEENNSSDDDVSMSDAKAIRKQLEGLENMYSEVMKLLGVRKTALNRYQSSDTRGNKRRVYGSVSSLPSSVSSRPIRDRHRRPEDRKKFVRDIKGINKRFQRLESHVVTLARSVAHLSSEMRTQHLMIQEMEVIRNELTNLRAQTNMLTVRSQSMPRFHHFPNTEQVNSSPDKMKKLTKFFGDEPPLLRLFLKKLGYEKYATVFEKEKIGLVELPYMSEERLQKLGIPMGPRLRILQEAQLGFPGAHENTLCIV